jgi:hypothetical protein
MFFPRGKLRPLQSNAIPARKLKFEIVNNVRKITKPIAM